MRQDGSPTSPRYQIAANATLQRPVSQRFSVFATGVVQYQSSSYSFVSDQRNDGNLPVTVRFGRPAGQPVETAFRTELSPYAIGNFRVGLRSVAGWEAALFLNNVWNERAELALDRERGGEGRVAYLVNQPRTVGIELRTAALIYLTQ